MADQHKDLAYSTVLTPPSPGNSGLTLVVQSGDGAKYPTPPFNATVWPSGVSATTANSEIIRVTAIATDTLTFARAQGAANDEPGGPAARTIISGDQIAATITAKSLLDVERPLRGTRRIGSLTIIGHSYVAGATQVDTGVSNVYQESLVSKLQALLQTHEDNTVHLGMAGSSIVGYSLSGQIFGGWRGVAQWILPSNSAPINAAADVVRVSPAVAVGGAGIIVHGCNDFTETTVGFAGAEMDAVAARALIAAKNAYRFCISRLRSGAVFCTTMANGAAVRDATVVFTGTWSEASAFSQVYTTGAFNQNTIAYATPAKFTLTLPLEFTGGYVVVNLIGSPKGISHITSSPTSAAGQTITIFTQTEFPASGTTFVCKIGTEEALVTVTAGPVYTLTTRGVNGTAAAAHTSGDVIIIADDTVKVQWSGTVFTAGSNPAHPDVFTSGQGGMFVSGLTVPISVRFLLTAADAGKTIIGTPVNNVAADTTTTCGYDSWHIESSDPPPVVVTNLHDWEYGATIAMNSYVAAWNTMITAVTAEFTDGFARVADVYSLFQVRNGLLGTTLNATDTTTGDSGTSSAAPGAATLTDSTKAWVVNAYAGLTVRSGGKTMVVASNTATVITGTTNWVGGTPATTTYTIGAIFTANSAAFTPTVGLVMMFGFSREITTIVGVQGTAPNWTLALQRGTLASVKATHAVNDFLGAGDWIHTDGLHLSAAGHSVYAEVISQQFDAMPLPTTYQMAQVQGAWSQNSQNWSMGIVDSSFLYTPSAGTLVQGTVPILQHMAVPIYIPRMCNVQAIGLEVIVVGTGTIRFGLYMPNSTHALPGNLIQDFGTVANTSISTGAQVSTYQVLRPGWYWLSMVQETNAAALRCYNSNGLPFPQIMTPTTIGNLTPVGVSRTHGGGALPTVFGAATIETATARVPRMYLSLRTSNFS